MMKKQSEIGEYRADSICVSFFLLNSIFIIWLIERKFLIEYKGVIHQKGERL